MVFCPCLAKKGELDFSTFLTMMHRQMQQEDPQAEILEALKMADKQNKGYIQAAELRAKLTKLGEKLTNKEGGCSQYGCSFNHVLFEIGGKKINGQWVLLTWGLKGHHYN